MPRPPPKKKGNKKRKPRLKTPKTQFFQKGRLSTWDGHGVTSLGAVNRRVIRPTITVDLATDVANIKTKFLAPVSRNLMTVSGSVRYDPTFAGQWEDSVLDGAKLVHELRIMLTELMLIPTITKNDASAGLPLTFQTLRGLIDTYQSMQNLVIPTLSLAMAQYWDTPIQMYGAIPEEGRHAVYILPTKEISTLANIETLITSLIGNYDGIVHANRNGLPYVKFSRALVEPLAPVSISSQLAILMLQQITCSDDTGPEIAELDETTDPRYFQHFGYGEVWDAAALLRNQDAADSPKFLAAVAAAVAGKASIEYADRNATSFTAFDDTSTTIDYFRTIANQQSRDWKIDTGVGQLPVIMNENIKTVDGWNQMFIGWGTRHIGGQPTPNSGMPLLPDNINKGFRGSGNQVFDDTPYLGDMPEEFQKDYLPWGPWDFL